MRALLAALAALAMSTPVAVAVADPCEENGKQLTEWLRPLRQRLWYRAPFRLQPGHALVAVDPGSLKKADTLPERGYLVELGATEVRLDGKVTTDAALAADLRTSIEALARLGRPAPAFPDDIVGGLVSDTPATAPPPSPPPSPEPTARVLLAVSPDVPWSRVVATAKAARAAGAGEIGFVFAASGLDVKPPGPSPIDARLQTIAADTEPARKAKALRTVLDEVVARCPDARPVVDANDAVAVAYASVFLSRCKCAVDLPSLRAFAWFMNYTESPMMTVHAPVSGRRTIKLSLSGRTPWAVAHKRVLAKYDSGRPVVLVSR